MSALKCSRQKAIHSEATHTIYTKVKWNQSFKLLAMYAHAAQHSGKETEHATSDRSSIKVSPNP
jgi:hypothetical protein